MCLGSDVGENENTVIGVENLTAGYDEDAVIEDISFAVRQGEIFFILGGSGSGKTTLLKHMIGLVPPMAGRIMIGGRDFTAAEGAARNEILEKIGVMYQGGALFGSMTLRENIRLPLEEYTDLPSPALDLITAMKLKLVGLPGTEEMYPAELSGGMRKRAAIARAMALDPGILFLDEPTTGLDPVTAAEIDRLVQRLARVLGITFVIVTHDLASVAAIADRLIMLHSSIKGIIAEGTPDEVRAQDTPEVRQFFSREKGVVGDR
jgi:phospholipid/cholesterol/gamma-HCH transport system ATP-binding protein